MPTCTDRATLLTGKVSEDHGRDMGIAALTLWITGQPFPIDGQCVSDLRRAVESGLSVTKPMSIECVDGKGYALEAMVRVRNQAAALDAGYLFAAHVQTLLGLRVNVY